MNETNKTQRAEAAAAASARGWNNLANALTDLRLLEQAKGQHLRAEKTYDCARFARYQSIRALARRILAVHS